MENMVLIMMLFPVNVCDEYVWVLSSPVYQKMCGGGGGSSDGRSDSSLYVLCCYEFLLYLMCVSFGQERL